MKYLDAHNHAHDRRLEPFAADLTRVLLELPLEGAMVNGTSESDWGAVEDLALREAWARPAYGLHPWKVAARSEAWSERLEELLRDDPRATVGEVGLDRWVEGHDLPLQTEILERQLAVANRYRRPVTVHCLKAWGALWELLHSAPRPKAGFLLHAYGGPAEMVTGFAQLGAYFSFNAYFLHERKAVQRETFGRIPLDRLLVETDAPDMLPPRESNPHPLVSREGEPLNHPGNLVLAYEGLAEIRQMPLAELAGAISANFARLFG